FPIGCSRWPCFLAHDVFVLDASGGSVVVLQTALYTVQGDAKRPPRQYMQPHDFMRFDTIDAAFEPLPDEAALHKDGYSTRQGIALPAGPIELVVYDLLAAGKARPAFDLAQTRLQVQPDATGMLYAYAQAAERAHMEKAAE